MLDWIALGKKLLGILKEMGAVFQEKPSKGRTVINNKISNNSGTINQYFYVAGDQPSPKEKKIKEFHSLIKKYPHSIESLDLAEKKELLKGNINIDKKLFEFITLYIPQGDNALWRAGLILRQHFKKGENELVAKIKLDMINSDPVRGKNIANLCTAGYLESEIIPMHKTLTELERGEDFKHFYKALVTQAPTSIFVGIQHNEKSLKTELLLKIEYAKKYSAPYVKVHALGKHNVELAKKVINEAKEEIKFEESSIFSTESHLDVTIDLKNKELN